MSSWLGFIMPDGTSQCHLDSQNSAAAQLLSRAGHSTGAASGFAGPAFCSTEASRCLYHFVHRLAELCHTRSWMHNSQSPLPTCVLSFSSFLSLFYFGGVVVLGSNRDESWGSCTYFVLVLPLGITPGSVPVWGVGALWGVKDQPVKLVSPALWPWPC